MSLFFASLQFTPCLPFLTPLSPFLTPCSFIILVLAAPVSSLSFIFPAFLLHCLPNLCPIYCLSSLPYSDLGTLSFELNLKTTYVSAQTLPLLYSSLLDLGGSPKKMLSTYRLQFLQCGFINKRYMHVFRVITHSIDK